jgi:hypothetical protein
VGRGRSKAGENFAKEDNISSGIVNEMMEKLDRGIMELSNDGILE